jgi:hypothetical protein
MSKINKTMPERFARRTLKSFIMLLMHKLNQLTQAKNKTMRTKTTTKIKKFKSEKQNLKNTNMIFFQLSFIHFFANLKLALIYTYLGLKIV